jgi:hypothetical protein
MSTPETVVEPVVEPVLPVEPSTENATPETKKPDEAKPDDKKPEEESSVIKDIRRANRRLQAELREVKEKLQTAIPKELPPTREQFQDDGQFVDARYAFNRRQEQVAQQPTASVVQDKISQATREHADFAEKMREIDHVRFPSAQLNEAMSTLQYGADVLYHLASNPEVAEEIAVLPPAAFAARLGEINAEIRIAKRTPKLVSSAPAPLNSEKSGATPPKGYDAMTPEEFHKVRMAERKKARMAVGG